MTVPSRDCSWFRISSAFLCARAMREPTHNYSDVPPRTSAQASCRCSQAVIPLFLVTQFISPGRVRRKGGTSCFSHVLLTHPFDPAFGLAFGTSCCVLRRPRTAEGVTAEWTIAPDCSRVCQGFKVAAVSLLPLEPAKSANSLRCKNEGQGKAFHSSFAGAKSVSLSPVMHPDVIACNGLGCAQNLKL